MNDKSVTLSFSGQLQARIVQAVLFLTSQNYVEPPIVLMFSGQGIIDASESLVRVSKNTINIVCDKGKITIPKIPDDWGTCRMLVLSSQLNFTMTY